MFGVCVCVCVSYRPKQSYLGRAAVALTGSPREPEAKAFTIASVTQDYNQEARERGGLRLPVQIPSSALDRREV